MNQIGIFLRVLLGLVVGFMSLIAFSLAPWALANVNFAFFGGGGSPFSLAFSWERCSDGLHSS